MLTNWITILVEIVESDDEISRQRIVTPEEFEELVTEGRQYLGTLPNGKIVVKNKQGSD